MGWTNEAEARNQIKDLVGKYYHDFKEKKESFKAGDRISYASRVFDEKEMQSLTAVTTKILTHLKVPVLQTVRIRRKRLPNLHLSTAIWRSVMALTPS